MSRLHKFLALPAPEQWLLMKAVARLTWTSIGLRILPFSYWRHRLGDATDATTTPPGVSKQSAERIAWAVGVAAAYVPGATCLVQALVARSMMLGQGFPAQVRIGVRPGETSRMEAHAWLVVDGQVVLGDSPGCPHTVLGTSAGTALGAEPSADSARKPAHTS